MMKISSYLLSPPLPPHTSFDEVHSSGYVQVIDFIASRNYINLQAKVMYFLSSPLRSSGTCRDDDERLPSASLNS